MKEHGIEQARRRVSLLHCEARLPSAKSRPEHRGRSLRNVVAAALGADLHVTDPPKRRDIARGHGHAGNWSCASTSPAGTSATIASSSGSRAAVPCSAGRSGTRLSTRGSRGSRPKSRNGRPKLQPDLPSDQSLANLIGKFCGIRSRGYCLWSQKSTRLVLPMAIVRSTPAIDHYFRTKRANHAHHIFHWQIVAPDLHRPLRALGEACVHRARKKLVDAIELSRSQQFRRANYAQWPILLGPDRILAALPARNCQKPDFRA